MIALSSIQEELSALSRFYRARPGYAERLPDSLSSWLESYAEIVLGEHHFEVITGGIGCAGALADLARQSGASSTAIDHFLSAAEAFPECMLGLKIRIGRGVRGQPTLYVRTMAPLPAALALLQTQGHATQVLAQLRQRFNGTTIMYGLGFFTDQGSSGVKTYSVADLDDCCQGLLQSIWQANASVPQPRTGFISYRLDQGELRSERKYYLPNLPLSELFLARPPWPAILHFAAHRLGYQVAGHLGVNLPAGEVKLYVERVGAIANDFSAR